MDTIDKPPETLQQAVLYFADEDRAHAYVVALRWPDGKPACPKCGSIAAHYPIPSRRLWKCRDCRKQFSVKVGTVFEDSPITFAKWLPAMWMLANCKNGISSYELARDLKVTQKTAWFMLSRLRLAMQPDGGGKMDGTVEVDDTFIGGKARNMHKERRERKIHGRGGMDKTCVTGMLERGRRGKTSRVRASVTKNGMTSTQALAMLREAVADGARVHTDDASSFVRLAEKYAHAVVNHTALEWVRGSVHTNGIENFWTLLKRTVKGTYVSIAPFHAFRYLDEQAFRFNGRDGTDRSRFDLALRSVAAKRLTYAALTGAMQDRRIA